MKEKEKNEQKISVNESEIQTKAGDFALLLSEVKQRIQLAQTKAVLAVNSELVRLYWDIGRIINARQKQEGWGSAVIPRLARELKNELPELKGFSERNIGRMIAFFRDYPDPSSILPQPVAEIASSLLWSVPWAHHVILMEKVSDIPTRIWYMEQTLANGWSRNVLAMQIESQAHTRHGKVLSNFSRTLPAHQSDLVQQTLKDPYIFDFLTLTEPFQERELETGLIRHLEKFLLELGQGFAFVGRQYEIKVGDEDFYIDLLFYHLRLRCYVVIELKVGEFKPEYAGKMNFYLSAVDDMLRHPEDRPSIGLILCKRQNRLVAEYALRDVSKPMGVATYRLTDALPAELQESLPSIEELEKELRYGG
jgi:predicted nuclease of restriction endonuclease-like (RecB) superfamily